MACIVEALLKVNIPGAAVAADGVTVEPKLNQGVGLNMDAVVD